MPPDGVALNLMGTPISAGLCEGDMDTDGGGSEWTVAVLTYSPPSEKEYPPTVVVQFAVIVYVPMLLKVIFSLV